MAKTAAVSRARRMVAQQCQASRARSRSTGLRDQDGSLRQTRIAAMAATTSAARKLRSPAAASWTRRPMYKTSAKMIAVTVDFLILYIKIRVSIQTIKTLVLFVASVAPRRVRQCPSGFVAVILGEQSSKH
jgi:hypothetical protein